MDTQQKLKQIIRDEFWNDELVIELSSNLINDIGFDELDLIEVAMAIEERFDIEISDEEIEKIITFGDMVTTIEKIIKQKEAL